MPDKFGNNRYIYECSECAAFTPDYQELSILPSVQAQTNFHDRFWENSNSEILSSELRELESLTQYISKFVGSPKRDTIIFEVGAGRGGLVKALLDTGYSVYACEPSAFLASIAQKYYHLSNDVMAVADLNRFAENRRGKPKCSALILWHVIEHIHLPVEQLKHLLPLVEDRGFVFMQVPLLKSRYIYPEHYYFFTHRTIEYLADAIGLGVREIQYDLDNFFVTIVLQKDNHHADLRFSNLNYVPDSLSQLLILSQQSLENLTWRLRDRERQIAKLENISERRLELIKNRLARLLSTSC